ncbi:hypothetical protein PO883_10335 [Massilia sp. DJPM01]|uniref:hypothetical protein n=1 Tax=Massilia sp. DJPM01 TaxID=3024404 RepID=UPI00259E432F|nr:hypothetical protein [Massilia sp. DJPM01]MDM5177589.1 hypothetical protein [Massilia sp. DJPM01]
MNSLRMTSACLAFSLSACTTPLDPIAVIHYRQLGVCTHAQTGSGAITAPAGHAIVVFKVFRIDNTKVGKSWSFDPATMELASPPMKQNLGGTGPAPVGAGQNVTLNARVGILVETEKPDGSDAAATNYFLVYPKVAPAPGTLGAKENSSQLSYPFAADCNAIAGG